jgi:hypothetical protein
MQKYHQEHAKGAEANKMASELVSAERKKHLPELLATIERERERERGGDLLCTAFFSKCVHREM